MMNLQANCLPIVEVFKLLFYTTDHFNWKSTIKAVLRQAPDQQLPIKRLRKKVNGIHVLL